MLKANNSRTVGPTKAHASARSDSPCFKRAGARVLSPPGSREDTVPGRRANRANIIGFTSASRLFLLQLAVFLEDFFPVLLERVECGLRRALAGDDVVMHAVLHREQQLRVGRLGPEVLDD